jgi:mannose-6-phosphate isomerase-like protein (cupin superfamily)
MEINEFISSGIIEVYCLGIATEMEKEQVEKFASENNAVRDEILIVREALELYVTALQTSPPATLKNKIMAAILNSEKPEQPLDFPPRLTEHSTVEEWMNYITGNHITPPKEYASLYLLDLPGDKRQSTYIVWARHGAVVEESHRDEDEYLLMLEGNCSIAIDGKILYYHQGDLVFIPKESFHRAEVLSEEPMVVIGQRIAA